MKLFTSALRALTYFTILPMPERYSREPPDALSLLALPIIGAGIGAAAGWAGYGLSTLLPVGICVGAVLIVEFCASGMIHLDGFLDSCDALFVPATPQRRREILSDPRHGTFALGGIALLTVTWVSVLGAVSPAQWPLILSFSGAVARYVVLPLRNVYPYAGASPASPLRGSSSSWIVVLGLLLALIIGARLVSSTALAGLLTALAFSFAFANWSASRLGGGLSGDVYGFIICAVEPLILLGCALPFILK